MTFLARQLFRFVYLLNSEQGTNALAAGIALGMVLGFSPILSLQSLLVFVALLVFRVQFGAALLSMGVFKLVSPALTSVFHAVGDVVLSVGFLTPVYRILYDLPVVPLTRFYNTVVTGAGVLSVVLTPGVFLLARWLIDRYRATVLARLKQSRYWKLWKSTELYRWYERYQKTFG